MEYTVNLNEQDIKEIVAEKFNTKLENIYYSKEDGDITVNFKKEVKTPEKRIGFV